MRLSAKLSRRTPPAPARVQERFEKTRSRMVYHAFKGAWGCFPNKPHRELWYHDAPLAISERTLSEPYSRPVDLSKSFHEQIWIVGCRFSHKMV